MPRRCSPFYYLANVLSAHVDQSQLWKESDLAIASTLDAEGGIEIADANSKLCRLASFSRAWGLPHMLRLVSKEGKGGRAAVQGCVVC